MAIINGTPGNDTLTGTQFADTIFGFAGNDLLLGLGGKDSLNGGAGSDTLDGGVGVDTLAGGIGNDVYIIDNINDLIIENANAGIDTVQSSISYILDNNLENLSLTGSSAINGTGNSLNNRIIGNSADNFLIGGEAENSSGNDTLYGNGGNDTLVGNSDYFADSGDDVLFGGDGDDFLYGDSIYGDYDGNDVLYGGNGNDYLAGGDQSIFGDASDTLYGGNGDDTLYAGFTRYGNAYNGDYLYGGKGNDTYILQSTGHTIQENPNSGIDTVQSRYSYTLGSHLENLVLLESSHRADVVNGTGNNLNNTITGSSINNVLKGLEGNDSLNGGAGNDQLLGGFGLPGEKDTLTGGVGRDTFLLGDINQVFYDDRNPNSAGRGDYALITDLNTNQDAIQLNGRRTNYLLAPSPTGLPTGTAIYRRKPGKEPNELIAIVQGRSGLSLNGNYFRFTANEVNLSQLNGRNGFVISGINQDDRSGDSVSTAGDFNGDGFDDFIIGAPGAGQSSNGQSYVVFGKPGSFSPSLNLSTLNGSNGFTINATNQGSSLGASVSEAGDINGDGFSDLIIGDPFAPFDSQNNRSGTGQSYVVFGKPGSFSPSLNLSTLNGTNGFTINGINQGDRAGASVSKAGDINGDGFDDLIVGAPDTNSNNGQSYVVFGKAGSFSPNLNLSSLNGSNGFTINGSDYSLTGFSVSAAGDINNDGFDDVIVGAPSSSDIDTGRTGSSYIIFGKASFNSSFNLSSLNGSNGFAIDGIKSYGSLGFSVSQAGDINGDGFDDIIIGDPASGNGYYTFRNDPGQSYVVFGKAEGFGARLNLSQLNGTNGFTIKGIDPNSSLGFSVSTAGDVNGDGFDDIIVGAPNASSNLQSGAGESYVIFGKATGFGANFDLFDINGRNGFVINGINTGDFLGQSVSSAGDLDGDGFADFTIGADYADPNGKVNAGESYVVFGRDFTNKVTRLGTDGDDTLIGTNGDDILIGGRGNDRLIGGRGVDVLYGGAGDDTLSFGVRDRRLDGGSGTDTLTVDTSVITIDLTSQPRNQIRSIEIIDLTGTGDNNLILTRLNLLNLSESTNRLIVNGNAGDSVTSTGQGWLNNDDTTTLNGIRYNQFTSGAATLLVETDIAQIIS